jgi:hypothetical protein
MGRDGTHPGPAARLAKKEKKDGQHCGSRTIAMNNSTGVVDIFNEIGKDKIRVSISFQHVESISIPNNYHLSLP